MGLLSWIAGDSTQCMRCMYCKESHEKKLKPFIDDAVSDLAEPMECKDCGKYGVGISSYSTGDEHDDKMREVIGMIRYHKSYNGKVFTVDKYGETYTWG